MESNEYHALMDTVQKVGRRIREVFPDKSHVGIMIEGLDVAEHAHIKVFPFNTTAEYRAVPNMSTEPDHDQLAELAAKLAF